MFIIPLMLLFAALNRLRGQHEDSTNTTEARMFYCVFPALVITTLIADLFGFPKLCGVPCALLAWGGIALGHSFAQNNNPRSFAEMGLVSATRMGAILLPLQVANAFYRPLHDVLWLVVPAQFFLTMIASAVSYSAFFQNRTLRLFGVNWCVPGDSSWEELLIGACDGLVYAIIITAS